MQILEDFRKTKKIKLPSFPDSEVEILSGIIYGELRSTNIKVDDPPEVLIEKFLPRFIKSWNFCDGNKKPLPVDFETLKLMPVEDIGFLTSEIVNFVNAEKKSLKPKQ